MTTYQSNEDQLRGMLRVVEDEREMLKDVMKADWRKYADLRDRLLRELHAAEAKVKELEVKDERRFHKTSEMVASEREHSNRMARRVVALEEVLRVALLHCTEPHHNQSHAEAMALDSVVSSIRNVLSPKCTEQHTFGEDLGSGRRSECVFPDGHEGQHEDSNGRWWTVHSGTNFRAVISHG